MGRTGQQQISKFRTFIHKIQQIYAGLSFFFGIECVYFQAQFSSDSDVRFENIPVVLAPATTRSISRTHDKPETEKSMVMRSWKKIGIIMVDLKMIIIKMAMKMAKTKEAFISKLQPRRVRWYE